MYCRPMMSGLMTEKIDELFTALVENKPITHAQIHRARSEYHVLRAVAQKAEQQRSAQKQRSTPRQPVEEVPVFSLEEDPVHGGESVTCPYCKQRLHRGKSADGRVSEDYEDFHNKNNELQVEVFQLKQEIHRKNREIKESEDQIKRLKSKISGAALSNDPNVIDLNDPNRSMKIGEKYSELYDNEWVDAFYYLENSANLREDKILDILQRILRWTESKRMENIKQRATPSKEIKK
ncbi:hypothetical protein KUTeg_005549 [Tegillarca granosa]|uniref:Uncharacterized protein n=1 Tax=Tegillarca granosa TaxID=220873 RepID=A0ABQ9FK44_TEGGR|nr:hypothetical protein KUTeg_005549 [Tegillarca granosa]